MAVTLGARAFTKIVAKGAAFGSTASFTGTTGEIIMTDAVGVLDAGVTVDTNADRSAGVRAGNLGSNVTVTAKNPVITLGEAPVSLRNLPIYFNALKSITPTNTPPSTVYTYAYSPTMTDVDTLVPQSFLVEDGYQKYIIDSCVPTELTLSAASDGMLQAGATWAGRQLATTTDANTASIAASQVFLPGRVFTAKYHTSWISQDGTAVTGTPTAYTSYITDWNLTLTPGAAPIMAMSGGLNAGGVAYQAGYTGTFSMTIASNATAATAFPVSDIGTVKYVWFTATTTVGGATYGFTFALAGILTGRSVIGGEGDGGKIVETADFELCYDSTSGKVFEATVLSPLTATP
jgi:hypothetical protein